ncbi:hypothetical protein [Candidatus Protochlamydia phocaeensis]|uniref:hypothetical protein n=1 Tax=Candidatus Protochlamydia phocaeensis TaxID=1414722 RepID=UPI000838ED59|nr:hypothetical protein [Candidatus Protochlamydia phocaeensis]
MTSLVGSIHSIASPFNRGMGFVATETKKGVLYLGELGANCAYDVYDLTFDGFDKWTKEAIAVAKFSTIVFSLGNLLKDFVAALEGHKELIYASKFIGSAADFIAQRNKVDETGNVILDAQGKPIKETYFQRPDIIKVLYAIANTLDAGKFVHKYIFNFSTFSNLATKIGSYQVSFLGKRVEEIPVVGNLCSSPKDFFIFIASGIENYRLLLGDNGIIRKVARAESGKRLQTLWGELKLEVLLKFAGSTGKMILITFGRTSSKTLWFAVVDVTTQSASLVKFFIDRHKKRTERFAHPSRSAAPAA